jgi:hypothetical protein
MTIQLRLARLESRQPRGADVRAILLAPPARGDEEPEPVCALLIGGGSLGREEGECATAFAARVEAEIAWARP